MSPEEQDVYDVLAGVLAELGGIAVEQEPIADDLRDVLLLYFQDHLDCPEGGPRDEDGCSEWAVSKAESAIELIRAMVLRDVRERLKPGRRLLGGCDDQS